MKMRDNPNNMESFYEENAQFSSQTPTIITTTGGGGLKRPLTLDLNAKDQPQKRQRFNNSVNTASVISSPDLQMLKMASPELEKFIMSGNTLQTPTPSLMFPQKVTMEQAIYAKGFEDALNSLHNNNNNSTTTNNNTNSNNNNSNTSNSISTAATTIGTTSLSMSGGSITYTNLDDVLPVAVKDEPQTVPNSPTLSPIDMESQERIKLERKRYRNRIAASKCRKRKLERISKLEDKVKMLKGENSELGSVVLNLKQHVIQLKQQIMEHVNAGCRIAIQSMQ